MLSSGYDRMVDEERLKSSGSNNRYGTSPERVSFHLKKMPTFLRPVVYGIPGVSVEEPETSVYPG